MPEGALRSHDTYLDALFNRGEESCRALYDRIAGKPSRTRQVSDRLVQVLRQLGLEGVLQTNVICYSTPRATDIRAPEHRAGLEPGTEIFETLVRIIQPCVLIVHGAATRRLADGILDLSPKLPDAPSELGLPIYQDYVHLRIFPVQSLSGAPYNSWKRWSEVWSTWLRICPVSMLALVKCHVCRR